VLCWIHSSNSECCHWNITTASQDL
jgi:hypothetical protein